MTYPHLGSLSDSELDAWVEHNVTFINKCAGFSYVVSLLACCVFLVTAFEVPHIAMRFLFAQIVLLGVGRPFAGMPLGVVSYGLMKCSGESKVPELGSIGFPTPLRFYT